MEVSDEERKEVASNVEPFLRNFYASDIYDGLKSHPRDGWLEVEEFSSFLLDHIKINLVIDCAIKEGEGKTKWLTKLVNPVIILCMGKVKSFGDTVRHLREKKGYSIKNLAGSLDVNYTYLSKIENNKSIPSEEFIEKIAHIFNCDPEELKARAGKIPEDIKKILRENPRNAIDYLRREFGGTGSRR